MAGPAVAGINIFESVYVRFERNANEESLIFIVAGNCELGCCCNHCKAVVESIDAAFNVDLPKVGITVWLEGDCVVEVVVRVKSFLNIDSCCIDAINALLLVALLLISLYSKLIVSLVICSVAFVRLFTNPPATLTISPILGTLATSVYLDSKVSGVR
ncbi:hypothetical protein FF38_14172 [Lucilia cuprina]|uniref:Uncharacterized protein n=1 Tax=Lucilia cuprina TaxID=7375 RepID=A0A0L0BWM9_LUCCU|nr:hypothetical protein FF38_14172 [Lucilia cuprina]